MYAQLKQLLRDKGYTPSAGDNWNAGDTREFSTFAHFELGFHHEHGHRLLSHPDAFPEMWEKLRNLLGSTPAPEQASVAVEVPSEPAPEPTAPAIVSAPVDDTPQPINLSAAGQAEKQELPEAAPEASTEPVVEEAPVIEETAPVEEAPTEPVVEEAPIEEAPVVEEAPAEEAPAEEAAAEPVTEEPTPVVEEAPAEEAPVVEAAPVDEEEPAAPAAE
jgi:hypothetical protein